MVGFYCRKTDAPNKVKYYSGSSIDLGYLNCGNAKFNEDGICIECFKECI